MKTLSGVLIVLVGLIALFLIVGLFVKKDYTVGKEVIVKRPKSTVFEYLKLLRNQSKFSVWASMDPGMRTIFTGTDGTVGFVSAWDSDNKNVGKGEQEIINIIYGERIDYEIRFIKPFKSKSRAFISTTTISDDQTRVHWEFNGKMGYPFNLMLLFMNMEKMVGADLDKGLQNLKNLLEK